MLDVLRLQPELTLESVVKMLEEQAESWGWVEEEGEKEGDEEDDGGEVSGHQGWYDWTRAPIYNFWG